MAASFCLPVKRIVNITLIPWLLGFFFLRKSLQQKILWKKEEKTYLCFDTLQRGDPCCSITSLLYQGGVALRWIEMLPQKMVKCCKGSCQCQKYFGPHWISLWQEVKGTRVDRMINFYYSFETGSASWRTAITLLNQFKMDLEGAPCLGLPCLEQKECLTSSINFTSEYPVAKLEGKEILEWQRSRISGNPGGTDTAFQGTAPLCHWVLVSWSQDRLAFATPDPTGPHIMSLEAIFYVEAACAHAVGFCC